MASIGEVVNAGPGAGSGWGSWGFESPRSGANEAKFKTEDSERKPLSGVALRSIRRTAGS